MQGCCLRLASIPLLSTPTHALERVPRGLLGGLGAGQPVGFALLN